MASDSLNLARALLSDIAQGKTGSAANVQSEAASEQSFAQAVAAMRAKPTQQNAVSQAAQAQRQQLQSVSAAARLQETGQAENLLRSGDAEIKRLEEQRRIAMEQSRKRASMGIMSGLLTAAGYILAPMTGGGSVLAATALSGAAQAANN